MHILLGLLGSIVTILWILHRLAEMGIDLGGLNPWYWRRRRAWRKKYEGDPIFAVEDPMEVAALFTVAIAKLNGDISAEQKRVMLSEFTDNFSLNERDASQLLGSSTHLLGPPQTIGNQLTNLIERHKETFSDDQVRSMIEMMQKVAAAEGAPNDDQQALLSDVESGMISATAGQGAWKAGG